MFKNLLLALFSCLFTLILMEVALQIIYPDKPPVVEEEKSNWANVPEKIWTEYHPQLGWYHQSNKEVHLKKRGVDATVHTNSVGFRGLREYTLNKPENLRRVMVLGDSFTFGFGVEDDEVFTARLESKFNDLEVLNLGVPGYGLDQMLVAYREIGKRYETDDVVIAIFPDDFWRATRAFADSGHAKPYFTIQPDGKLLLNNVPVPQQYELKVNQFPDIVHYSKWQKFLRKSILYRKTAKGLKRLGKNIGLVDPSTELEWVLGKAILDELVSEIKARDQNPILMIVPPDRWANSDRKTSLRKSLLRYADRKQLPMLDLTPVFQQKVRESDLQSYYIEGDGHWTPLGHQLAADKLEEVLSDA